MKFTRIWMKKVLFLSLCLLFVGSSLWAIRNICDACHGRAEIHDVRCPACQAPLNKCLECGKENQVKSDYCTQCAEPLAEMRLLAKIDDDLRAELQLGKSDRAQLERELGRLQFQLGRDPGREEIYLYRIAKIYKSMKFYAREAQLWEDFIRKFPESPKKSRVRAFLSEATRQWGYLFYQQKQIPQAMEKFQRAAQINPLNDDAWMWIARLHSEQKRFKDAAEAYLNALRAHPGHPQALSFLRGLKRTAPAELRKAGPPVITLTPLEIAPYEAQDLPNRPLPSFMTLETVDPDAPATE
jgi:tetratricopeptide (TPR) repeat protein